MVRHRSRRLLAALNVWVLAALACSFAGFGAPAGPLPAATTPSGGPPAAPSGTPAGGPAGTATLVAATAGPGATPTVTATPGPPGVGLLEVVLARIRSGEWSEAEATIAGLRYLVGEVSAEDAFGDVVISDGDGSTLMRLAMEVSEHGAPAERAEVDRLVARILPPTATLERFARPAGGAGGGGAAGGRQARGQWAPPGQDQRCRELWASGFSSPDPLICLEYASLEIGGRTHRLFYPATWPDGGPERAALAATLEAIERSLEEFNGYGLGPVMATTTVFAELEYLDPDTGRRDPDVLAVAARRPNEDCRVAVFPSALSLGSANVQQTMAHELFHCFQYTNLDEQESGPSAVANAWWVEGSAMFFSNVVYPHVNEEWEWVAAFDEVSSETALLDMDYHDTIFFQYLANRAGFGHDGIIRLLAGMPTSGGRAEQLTTLAGVAGIDELLQDFGRKYVDGVIRDTSGAVIPSDLRLGRPLQFGAGSQSERVTAEPFVLVRRELDFADDVIYDIAAEPSGVPGLEAAEAFTAPGQWGPLPTGRNTACDPGPLILLVTSTEASPSQHVLALNVTGEEAPDLECDRCLIGRWEMPVENLRGYFETAYAPLGMQLDSLSGTFVWDVRADGSFTWIPQDYVLAGHQDDPRRGRTDYRGGLTGLTAGLWGTRAGELVASDVEHAVFMTFSVTAGGQTIELPPQPLGPGGMGLAPGSYPYTCTETTLEVVAPPGLETPVERWTYTRVVAP